MSFFGGSPRKVIVDNLKAAVLNGSGREACYHPDFLALCGYFCLQPVACQRRDPESKGIVEGGVRYVKRNALAGRAEQLTTFEDYQALAVAWRDEVANVRRHESTHERPVDRFQTERSLLRVLPALPFDTDEVVPAVVSPASSAARCRTGESAELIGATTLTRAGSQPQRKKRRARTGPVWRASGPFVNEALRLMSSVDDTLCKLVSRGYPLALQARLRAVARARVRCTGGWPTSTSGVSGFT